MALIRERSGPADWQAGQLGAHWRIRLREQDRTELLAAVDAVVDAGIRPANLTAADFPLPGFGSVLSGVATELTQGCGFVLLQGIPVAGLTEHQCDVLAVGIGSHLGQVMPQPGGQPFVHVRDHGADPAMPTTHSYQHSARLGFHSDPTEVVALLCVRPAVSGGRSIVASAVAVHNEIVREHRAVAEVLYEPWWRDLRRGDDPDSFAASPVYAVDDHDRLVANYGADYIRSAQRSPHTPRLTERQLDAMAVMDRLTDDPRFALTMDLQAGDMQFLNNDVIWHSRTEYQDDPDPARHRDLIRIWLAGLNRQKFQ
jgi:hypothetical protein